MKFNRIRRLNHAFLALLLGLLWLEGSVIAQSVPDELVYEGQLFDVNDDPIVSTHTIRISLWSSDDYVLGDIDGAGAINTGATNYAGWVEVQTFTPVFNGSFSVELGAVTSMPTVDFSTQKYFQIEIKPQGAPNTSYEVLDPTGDDMADTNDRQKIGSVIYAKNAETINNAEIGTDSGDIATLGAGGQFLESQIPDGTDEETFTLDNNNDAAGNIVLQFGKALGKNLFWNAVSSWFEFNDSVKVDGDLEVTGDLITADQNVTEVLSPRYPGSVFEEDGSTNVGSMRESQEAISGEEKTLLNWVTRRSTLQDYDITIRYQLPENFRSFQTNALGINFLTTGNYTDAKIDFQAEKEGVVGNQVKDALGDDVIKNTFGLTSFELKAVTPWSPGDVLLIKIKTYVKDTFVVKLGDIYINTVE